MASQFGDLNRLIGDIERKVDSICRKKCREYNLDEKKLLGKEKDGEKKRGSDEGDAEAESGAVDVGESATSASVKKDAKPKNASDASSFMPAAKNTAQSDEEDEEDAEYEREQREQREREEQERRLKEIEKKIRKRRRRQDDEADGYGEDIPSEYGGSDADDYSNLGFNYEYSATSETPDIAPGLNFRRNGSKKEDDGSGLTGGLKRFAMKKLSKYGFKKGVNAVAKKGLAKAGAKAGAKVGGKALSKGAGKLGAKSLAKKLPLGLGLIPAAAFAADRAMEGDFSGAGLELASGAAAAVPVVGTTGSLGIDAYLADRDVRKATGKGLMGHGMDKAGELAGKYAEHRINKMLTGESFERFNTLYDRAKAVFEAESGVNESVDGYCFDDYVMESKIDNLAVSREIDESKVFFGYGIVCESFGGSRDEEELRRLFQRISPDGKVSMDDLVEKDSDMPETIAVKRRIRTLLGGRRPSSAGTYTDADFNAKEYRKAYDMSLDQSGQPTNLQLWHKGLDQLGSGVARGLERNFLIPQELSKKLNIPKNLGRLAGAGVGGLLFGPVGAVAGTALANWMANSHEKYKARQYAKYHGLDEKNARGKRSGYVGSLAGAGLGTLVGGPVGGILGAGVGHFLDRKTDASINPASRTA